MIFLQARHYSQDTTHWNWRARLCKKRVKNICVFLKTGSKSVIEDVIQGRIIYVDIVRKQKIIYYLNNIAFTIDLDHLSLVQGFCQIY